MDKNKVRKSEEKAEMINIRISANLKQWIEAESFSPTKIFKEAVAKLGYKEVVGVPTLQDYADMVTDGKCSPCIKAKADDVGNRETSLTVTGDSIEHYDHDGGWSVEGFKEKQWLYITCGTCGYQWALQKLGVPR